jgi:hypothetical protein
VIWATRRDCHVDRTACAWLIRRFLDPEAEFVFVDDPDEVPADATAFDIRGAELSHHDGDCSFETFLVHYGLHDEALEAIARLSTRRISPTTASTSPKRPGWTW